jgi:hypothetical protein
VCGETYPCDAIRLLDDLEQVEAVARSYIDQTAALRRRVEEPEATAARFWSCHERPRPRRVAVAGRCRVAMATLLASVVLGLVWSTP